MELDQDANNQRQDQNFDGEHDLVADDDEDGEDENEEGEDEN